MLLDGREVFPASEILSDSDFFLEAHREVFRAMLALSADGCPIDLITVREELRRRNKEEAAGGIAYLAYFTDGLPRGTNLAHYARTDREKANDRNVVRVLEGRYDLAVRAGPGGGNGSVWDQFLGDEPEEEAS